MSRVAIAAGADFTHLQSSQLAEPGIISARATESGEFTDLDSASDIRRHQLTEYLDALACHPEIRRVRTTALELLRPAAGERLLDAGCGMGEVARELWERVGPTGEVAAIDHSEHAVAAARSRCDGGTVHYAVGDITALDFPDGHFDGVYTERVLQHLPDPDAGVAELVRVTRRGGRVCIVDTDWLSFSWDGFDHLTEVRDLVCPAGRDLSAGRVARGRLIRAGLHDITVLPVTLCATSPADAAVLAWPFFDREFLQTQLPAELFDRYFASVERSIARGDLLFAFTMWICLGRLADG